METFEQVWKKIDKIPGWLPSDDAKVLYELSTNLPPKSTVLEIGTYQGRSAVLFASNLSNRVVCIDPLEPGTDEQNHLTITEAEVYNLHKNIDLYSNIEWVRKRSINVIWDDLAIVGLTNYPIRLIFIDANHQYPFPKEDYKHFYPLLEPECIVAFHDYGKTFPGVRQSVEELQAERLLSAGVKIGSVYVAHKF